MKKLLIAVLIFGIGTNTYANVFGEDNRQILKQSAFGQRPYSMIVRVGNCTGAIVGKNLVLTAYHCINKAYKSGKLQRRITVKVGAYKSKTIEKTKVIDVVTGGVSGTAQDWALLIVKDNIGERFGYFSINDNVNTNYSDINLAGYSADLKRRVLSLHQNCSITYIMTDQLLHNCDSTGGASGSPLWRLNDEGQYEIVGVHFGGRRSGEEDTKVSRLKVDSYSHELANVASRPLNFIDAILEKR